MGFFSDAYDLFSISLLTKLLGRIYYQDHTCAACPGSRARMLAAPRVRIARPASLALTDRSDRPGSKPGVLPIEVNALVTALALVGTLSGQLSFGWLGDRLGRKRVYGLALALMIGSSAGSGLTFGPTTSPTTVIGTLCAFPRAVPQSRRRQAPSAHSLISMQASSASSLV